MNITSTRRVSASYASPSQRSYDAAPGGQSFVETIDTSNNVSISDEHHSNGRRLPSRSFEEEDEFVPVVEEEERPVDQSLQSTSQRAPLLDNDDSLPSSNYQNKNVEIYGVNQEISQAKNERVDNPYLKYFYENNGVIEDIDEFV